MKSEFQNILNNIRSVEFLFDKFEILASLAYLASSSTDLPPLGRYCWRMQSDHRTPRLTSIFDEAQKKQQEWEPIAAGMFDGSFDSYLAAKIKFDDVMQRVRPSF